MSLQITGKVISVLEEKSGTGQNGEWRHSPFCPVPDFSSRTLMTLPVI